MEKLVRQVVLKTLLRIKPSETWSLIKFCRESGIHREIVEPVFAELEGLVTFKNGRIGVAENNRVQIAMLCLQFGSDPFYISKYLDWKEFEKFVASIVEAYGYVVYRGLRFKSMGRWWEIDVLAFKKPFSLCLNCKHYLKQNWSILKKAALEEFERAKALKQALKTLGFKPKPSKGWRILPTLVTMLKPRFKVYDGIPIVQVTELRNFLEELTLYVDGLKLLDV